MLVGLTGFTTYVGAIGSQEYTHPALGWPGCDTPMSRFGWTYEAINYDQADDAALVAANSDMTNCASQGTPAGDAVKARDGVRLAGWYIPAADGAGPTAPTVVIVPGWKSNKSEVLKYAPPFHEHDNLVLADLLAPQVFVRILELLERALRARDLPRRRERGLERVPDDELVLAHVRRERTRRPPDREDAVKRQHDGDAGDHRERQLPGQPHARESSNRAWRVGTPMEPRVPARARRGPDSLARRRTCSAMLPSTTPRAPSSSASPSRRDWRRARGRR